MFKILLPLVWWWKRKRTHGYSNGRGHLSERLSYSLKIRVMKQRLFTEEEIRQEYGRCTIGLIYDEEGDRKLSAIRVVEGDIHTLFTKEGDRFRKIGVYDMARINGSSAKK